MQRMRHFLRRLLRRARTLDPRAAYDRWAASYDAQTDNVVLQEEDVLFRDLLATVELEGKSVLDVGCGTGRHWPELLARAPAHLAGADVSAGMLERLHAKYPGADVHHVPDHHLPFLADASIDVVICTLAFGYFAAHAAAIGEWRRVLRPGGTLLVTDFHPEGTRRGLGRTFREGDRTYRIAHRYFSLDAFQTSCKVHGFTMVVVREVSIGDAMRESFSRAGRLDLFERNRGIPLLFGTVARLEQ